MILSKNDCLKTTFSRFYKEENTVTVRDTVSKRGQAGDTIIYITIRQVALLV